MEHTNGMATGVVELKKGKKVNTKHLAVAGGVSAVLLVGTLLGKYVVAPLIAKLKEEDELEDTEVEVEETEYTVE